MKIRIPAPFLVLGLVLALPLPSAFAAADKPMPSLNDEVVLTLTGTVEAINLETREITVKGAAGQVYTFPVDPEVKRLAEFKVGDTIILDYYASIGAELREPTAEEKAEPLSVLKDAGRGEAGASPKAGAYRIIRAVVTIEGLDRPTGTATVKGPRGNLVAIQVRDPSVLPKLHLGQTMVVVYTEAFAVRLEKAPAAKAKAAP